MSGGGSDAALGRICHIWRGGARRARACVGGRGCFAPRAAASTLARQRASPRAIAIGGVYGMHSLRARLFNSRGRVP